MIERISNAIERKYEAFDIANNKSRPIYLFGTYQLIMLLLNFISMLFIGFAFGQLTYCLLYMAMFIPPRVYAGGYHASSPKKCYIYSMLCVVLAMFIIKYGILNIVICDIITMVSGIVIFIIAPVEDGNNMLDDKAYERYKLCTRVMLVLEGMIYAAFHVLHWNVCVSCISLSFGTLCLIMLTGIKKNHTHNDKTIYPKSDFSQNE